MPTVRLPATLRPLVDGAVQVPVDGADVAAVIADLVARHPAVEDRILVDGRVAPWLNVFVGTDDVRTGRGIATSVDTRDVVTLVPAVAGG
ncbi:MAG TPA: MoaD/ThiS family protein [Nitriliruptoraceae bacterium]|nr:MoaD/ThiS family protein [Nitriliruptoraceae bacterium]